MAVATNRSPVVCSHPLTGQFVTLVKGMEFPDDDPIVKEQAWAFVADEAPRYVESVSIADVAAEVEQATRRPGEKRATKRVAAP